MGGSDRVAFRLNGGEVAVRGDHPHLLAALREELDVTSAKDGCSPSGQCGCCTVLIDGKAIVACTQPVAKIAGRCVVTLEGLDPAERDRYASAFAATGALQCGFCTPGIVVRAKALLDRKRSEVTRDDLVRHLGAHLCRCTGYVKILDALEALARDERVDEVAPRGIGTSGTRYEGHELALGDRGYVDDVRMPGLLHAALRLTDHARADVVAIDDIAARSSPGVVAVYTAADLPGELRSGLIHKDWPAFIPIGGRTSYAGDVLAVVVADTRDHARAAAELVEVRYNVLRPITDPMTAIDDPEIAVWQTEGNVLSVSEYRRGAADETGVDAALAASAHVIHEVFFTQRVEQAFLEPESTVAYPDHNGVLQVLSGGQGVWDDRDDIARALGLDRDQVVVTLVSNGGAFGGKEDLSNQIQTALAAQLLQRPVKCTLSREESFRVHAKRHPMRLEYWLGCDREGHLTALKVRGVGDSGAYASVGMKVLERAAGHASGPYRVPVIDVRTVAVRTNNPICGAFRGFGANQAQFAMEGCVDRLAVRAGLDPWEMRRRNVIVPGDVWGPGQIMDEGCGGAAACLQHIRPLYDEAVEAGKAVGLALGLKNSGLGNGLREVAKAVVRFRSDGVVEVRHGWTEMGQGVHTVALQVAVEELGIDPLRVEVIVDTTRELGFGQTTGSRGTLMTAGSVQRACRAADEGGRAVDVDYEGEYVIDWTNRLGSTEHPTIHSTFSYAAQMVVIDRESTKIERVVAVHDVGRVINPVLCEGQVEGSVHMGLGYALSEDFPADPVTAFPTASTLRQLGILRPKDVPQIDVHLIEVPQPNAPYGIKGVGEIGLVPTAPAVAAALYALDGEWRDRLPLRGAVSVADEPG